MKKNSIIGIISENDLIAKNLNLFLKKKGFKIIFFYDVNYKNNYNNLNHNLENFFKKNKLEYIFLSHALSGGISFNINYPAKLITQNLNLSTITIQLAYKYKIKKLVNISSSCIYPNNCKQPLKTKYLLTGKLEETNKSYALSKLSALYMCSAYNYEYKTNYVSVIPANYYGPYDKFNNEKSHVISNLIRKLHDAKINNLGTITVLGSGKPKRDFIYINDLIEAIYFVMMSYNKDTPLNITSNEVISIKELALKLKKIINFQGMLFFDKSKPDGMKKKFLDGKDLLKLGWKKKYSIDKGLKLTYKWYKNNL